MLKYALLGAAMAVTAPALAQTAPATQPAPTATTQTAPTTAPVESTEQAAPAPTTAVPAETAAAQPAPAEQVASVVDSQFGTYDKDADGKLSEPEFGAWMVALKAQTDPATDANAPATKSWNKAAFAQADTDKSKSVTKSELTGFLTPTAKS